MNPEPFTNPPSTPARRRTYGMDEGMHPVQIAGFRRMTPGRKLELVVQMYHAGLALKIAGLKMRHPDWDAEKLRREAQRCMRYAST